MSGIATRGETEEASATTDLSRDELFDILGHERRRCMIQFFHQNQGEVALDDLVEHVAAWENNKPLHGVTSAERKRVRTALQQSHLPKMEAMEVVKFHSSSDTIELTDSFTQLNIYLQVVGGTLPYSLLYLALSVFSAGLIAGLWLELPLLAVIPSVGWGAFIVTLFGLTSGIHLYDTRRMELVPDFPTDIE